MVNHDETGEIFRIFRNGIVKTFVYNGENLENKMMEKWCDVVVFTTLKNNNM